MLIRKRKHINRSGFNLIELIISIALISMISVSIGRFVNNTSKITMDIDDSLITEDSINYSSEFIREYIEVMEGIESIDGEVSMNDDGYRVFDFHSISFYNMDYRDRRRIYLRLNKKKMNLINRKNIYGLSYERFEKDSMGVYSQPVIGEKSDDHASNTNLNNLRDGYSKQGAELLDYSLDQILAIPLPIGCKFSEADGIKLIYVLEGRTGIYEFEKSYYFKNKKYS